MIMTPSKTGSRRSDAGDSIAPEWTAALHKDGADTSNARVGFEKSKAWWTRMADIIAGRR